MLVIISALFVGVLQIANHECKFHFVFLLVSCVSPAVSGSGVLIWQFARPPDSCLFPIGRGNEIFDVAPSFSRHFTLSIWTSEQPNDLQQQRISSATAVTIAVCISEWVKINLYHQTCQFYVIDGVVARGWSFWNWHPTPCLQEAARMHCRVKLERILYSVSVAIVALSQDKLYPLTIVPDSDPQTNTECGLSDCLAQFPQGAFAWPSSKFR